MTDKQIKQCIDCLPAGQTISRAYRAYEGDIRVISEDRKGNEYRYKVVFDEVFNVSLVPF
ncbi:MAG: hypothetical protein Q4F31_09295 [Eubacteriales bacterium]|nr:hypothetical protein [Eubacteriales bacterium]